MNPLILKEFIQSAHRRRTYVLRTALPLVAAVILLPQVGAVLAEAGQDWRSIARIARPFFSTCAWMQLIVFLILAASEAAAGLQKEWSQRTMEILCATPMSFAGIVYGKFISALGRVFVIGLALLPLMGIWFRLGRIPKGTALGSLGVIAASTVFAAGVGMADGAVGRPGRRQRGSVMGILLLVLLLPTILGVFVWTRHPVLIAAVPPWAFHYVMTASAPGGMSPTAFALLAMAVPLCVGLPALALSPWLFRRTYYRHVGAHAARRGRRWYVPESLRRILARRPNLGLHEDPFEWQEKGPPTRILRLGLWILYGLVAAVLLVIAVCGVPMAFLRNEPVFYLALAIGGAAWLSLGSGLYATHVFAREKVRNTAGALILTGNGPSAFYFAKIRAVYRALGSSFVGILGLLAVYVIIGWNGRDISLGVVAGVVIYGCFGPAFGAIIGMVFSAAARTPSGALGGILLAPVFSWGISSVLTLPLMLLARVLFAVVGAMIISLVMLTIGVAGIWLFYRYSRSWQVWRLSLLLAMSSIVSSGVMAAVVLPAGYMGGAYTPAVMFVAAFLTAVGLTVFWLRLGLRIFEGCMLGEPMPKQQKRPGKRQPQVEG